MPGGGGTIGTRGASRHLWAVWAWEQSNGFREARRCSKIPIAILGRRGRGRGRGFWTFQRLLNGHLQKKIVFILVRIEALPPPVFSAFPFALPVLFDGGIRWGIRRRGSVHGWGAHDSLIHCGEPVATQLPPNITIPRYNHCTAGTRLQLEQVLNLQERRNANVDIGWERLKHVPKRHKEQVVGTRENENWKWDLALGI